MEDRPDKSPYRLRKALVETDALADLTIAYNGEQVRLHDVPYFLECQRAWAEAKGRYALFGWPDFVQFFTEMIGVLPADGRTYKLVVLDSGKGFVRGNLRWESLDGSLGSLPSST